MNLKQILEKAIDVSEKWEAIMQTDHIKIWKWKNTPEILKNEISNHNDADYVAFVPDCLSNEYFGFLESRSFGCCEIEQYITAGGKLYVGYHS